MQRKILRTRWTRLQTIIKIIYELRFLKINDPTNWKNSKTIHASHLSFLFPFSITIIVTTFSPFLPIPQILATLSSFKRNILIFPSVLEFDKEKKTSLNFILEGKLIRSCTQGGGGERERERESRAESQGVFQGGDACGSEYVDLWAFPGWGPGGLYNSGAFRYTWANILRHLVKIGYRMVGW